MIRTRFAPSPTGHLHIGGARTALFNWLFARSQGGEFVLRIDDTDAARNQDEALKPILDGLTWLGLDWNGEPVHQSSRGDRYKEVLAELEKKGFLVRDYSTAEDREWHKREAEKAKRPFRWRAPELPDGQVAMYERQGRPWAYRFRVPSNKVLHHFDLFKGEVTVNTNEIADFVVARSDGSPLYTFATVVDEHDMGITHVLRADEHLTNTFPQILLYDALGWNVPRFGHMPFVAEPGSKQKLSKRKMDEYAAKGVYILVEQFREKGYLPEAMLNYLARLGWSLDDHTEIFSREELLKVFTLDRIVKAPASHDQDKLYHIQGEWMKGKSIEQKLAIARQMLLKDLQSWVALKGLQVSARDLDTPLARINNTSYLREVLEVLGDRFKIAEDIIRLGYYFFTDQIRYDEAAFAKHIMPEKAAEVLDWVQTAVSGAPEGSSAARYQSLLEYVAENCGVKQSAVNAPVRVAITGQTVGGGLYETMAVLDRQRCIDRLAAALSRRYDMETKAGKTDG